MKTCTACGETYSERIDFCFNDGAVLVLLPSALDAPVPRLAAAPSEGTSGRLRTELTEEAAPDPTIELQSPAFPARADEAPAPPRRREEEAVAVPVPAPAAPTTPTTATIPVASSSSEGIGALPVLGEPEDRPNRSGILLWFLLAAGASIVIVLLLWFASLWGHSGAVRLAPSPTPPVEQADAPPPAPTPEPAPQTAPEAPPPEAAASEAPAPIHAAPVAPSPAPPPTASHVAEDTTSAPRHVVRPAPTATASPWDAPTAVADATATFTSDPAGAVVRIDGRLRGKTPLDVKLVPGSHEIEVAMDGYVTSVRTMDIVAGEPKIPVSLHPAVREGNVLVVAAGWDGATLFVDGAQVGPLPVQVMLSQGNHIFEVRRGSERARAQHDVTLADRGLTRLTLDF